MPEPSVESNAVRLEAWFERSGLSHFELPEELERAYGGKLGFSRPRLFANFVSALDGTTALGGSGESGHVISGDSAPDRFVMGLLRACSEAVIVGAGTLRSSPKHLWHAARIFPPAAAHYAELRTRLGLPPEPKLVIVTGTGELDPELPALADAVIATSSSAAPRLKEALPKTAHVVPLGPAPFRLTPLVERLHVDGYRLLLTEGGPSLVGDLLAERLLDELFLTLSPRLFGRHAQDGRKALVEGTDLGGVELELLSARRHRSHLFLRYAVEKR